MILGKRILSAIHLVVLAGLVGVSATTAQTISVTDASAAPALVAPGDRVTIAVSLTNSDPTRAWAAGGRVDAIITFTHTVTGTSFPLSGTAVLRRILTGAGEMAPPFFPARCRPQPRILAVTATPSRSPTRQEERHWILRRYRRSLRL